MYDKEYDPHLALLSQMTDPIGLLFHLSYSYRKKLTIMCRYGLYGPYKDIYACFACRKVYKQTSRYELTEEERIQMKHCCPQCGKFMNDMGHDFKAPKQSDIKQWRKVEILFQHGFKYHSCGCDGSGYRPANLNEVYPFLEKNKISVTDGEKLLSKLTAKL